MYRVASSWLSQLISSDESKGTNLMHLPSLWRFHKHVAKLSLELPRNGRIKATQILKFQQRACQEDHICKVKVFEQFSLAKNGRTRHYSIDENWFQNLICEREASGRYFVNLIISRIPLAKSWFFFYSTPTSNPECSPSVFRLLPKLKIVLYKREFWLIGSIMSFDFQHYFISGVNVGSSNLGETNGDSTTTQNTQRACPRLILDSIDISWKIWIKTMYSRLISHLWCGIKIHEMSR